MGREAPTATLSRLAYQKIVYHAAKYPSATIVGVLVGADESSVDDVIPLTHHWHTLSPMTEAGLAMIEAHLTASRKQMVGVYEVPERLDATEVSSTTSALAKKIGERTSRTPIALMVRGDALLESKLDSLRAQRDGKTVTVQVPSYDTLVSTLTEHVHQGAWKSLADWDDHLENTQLDWLENAAISAL